jgi:hypothetical protein
MDSAGITNAAVQLTTEQISQITQDRIIGLLISMGLIVIGGLCGAKIRNDVGKVMGIISATLGAVGTVGFTLSLIELSTRTIIG